MEHTDQSGEYKMSFSKEKSTVETTTIPVPNDLEKVNSILDYHHGEVKRGLSSRHLQFIALCGSIGTGLFVGSGAPLVLCGPAPLLVSYLIVSIVVYFIMNFLSEMVCWIPLKGVHPAGWITRYVDRSLGFATGWIYWYSLAILVATENTAAGLVIEYWVSGDRVNIAVWMSIFWVIMVAVNFSAVQYYGETEFICGVLKLSCIIGLIICGIVIFFGGAPTHDRLGFRYWNNPGSFALHLASSNKNTSRFLDVWTAVIKSSFAFILAPELIITSSGEVERPRSNIAKASSRFIWRLIVFYICSIVVITVTVAYNDKNLVGAIAKGKSGAEASPFVVGIQNAGIKALNHIVNAVILTSAISSGNSWLYASSRTLVGLAKEGNAPKFFANVNRFGVPYYGVAAGAAMGLLAYLNCSNSSAVVFSWLSSIVTTGGFFGWICNGIAYLRWRKAVKVQELEHRVPLRTPFQPYGTWFAIIFVVICTLTNGYDVFINWDTSSFFASYVTFLIFFLLYAGHKIWFKTSFLLKVEDIDITTGLEEAEREEREEIKPTPGNPFEKFINWMF